MDEATTLNAVDVLDSKQLLTSLRVALPTFSADVEIVVSDYCYEDSECSCFTIQANLVGSTSWTDARLDFVGENEKSSLSRAYEVSIKGMELVLDEDAVPKSSGQPSDVNANLECDKPDSVLPKFRAEVTTDSSQSQFFPQMKKSQVSLKGMSLFRIDNTEELDDCDVLADPLKCDSDEENCSSLLAMLKFLTTALSSDRASAESSLSTTNFSDSQCRTLDTAIWASFPVDEGVTAPDAPHATTDMYWKHESEHSHNSIEAGPKILERLTHFRSPTASCTLFDSESCVIVCHAIEMSVGNLPFRINACSADGQSNSFSMTSTMQSRKMKPQYARDSPVEDYESRDTSTQQWIYEVPRVSNLRAFLIDHFEYVKRDEAAEQNAAKTDEKKTEETNEKKAVKRNPVESDNVELKVDDNEQVLSSGGSYELKQLDETPPVRFAEKHAPLLSSREFQPIEVRPFPIKRENTFDRIGLLRILPSTPSTSRPGTPLVWNPVKSNSYPPAVKSNQLIMKIEKSHSDLTSVSQSDVTGKSSTDNQTISLPTSSMSSNSVLSSDVSSDKTRTLSTASSSLSYPAVRTYDKGVPVGPLRRRTGSEAPYYLYLDRLWLEQVLPNMETTDRGASWRCPMCVSNGRQMIPMGITDRVRKDGCLISKEEGARKSFVKHVQRYHFEDVCRIVFPEGAAPRHAWPRSIRRLKELADLAVEMPPVKISKQSEFDWKVDSMKTSDKMDWKDDAVKTSKHSEFDFEDVYTVSDALPLERITVDHV